VRARWAWIAARKHAQVMEMEAVAVFIIKERRTRVNAHSDTRTSETVWQMRSGKHSETAGELEEKHLTERVCAHRKTSPTKKLFLLQVIQPGLAGLIDGSISTLAPIFAAAYATHRTWEAFLVGLAASIGAGISMGFHGSAFPMTGH